MCCITKTYTDKACFVYSLSEKKAQNEKKKKIERERERGGTTKIKKKE